MWCIKYTVIQILQYITTMKTAQLGFKNKFLSNNSWWMNTTNLLSLFIAKRISFLFCFPAERCPGRQYESNPAWWHDQIAAVPSSLHRHWDEPKWIITHHTFCPGQWCLPCQFQQLYLWPKPSGSNCWDVVIFSMPVQVLPGSTSREASPAFLLPLADPAGGGETGRTDPWAVNHTGWGRRHVSRRHLSTLRDNDL